MLNYKSPSIYLINYFYVFYIKHGLLLQEDTKRSCTETVSPRYFETIVHTASRKIANDGNSQNRAFKVVSLPLERQQPSKGSR